MEEILYWRRKIEEKRIEMEKPFMCEKKISEIIEEELFRNLKRETEKVAKELIAKISFLSTEIKANKKRIADIDETYDETKEKLIRALEGEKKDVHEQIKKLSEKEFTTVEFKGKAMRSGLEMQLKHCEEAEARLKNHYNELYSQLQDEKHNREQKMVNLKEEMNSGFSSRGKEILTNIEQNYLDIITGLKNEEAELRHKRHSLNSVVGNTKEENRTKFHILYSKLNRQDRRTGEGEAIGERAAAAD